MISQTEITKAVNTFLENEKFFKYKDEKYDISLVIENFRFNYYMFEIIFKDTQEECTYTPKFHINHINQPHYHYDRLPELDPDIKKDLLEKTLTQRRLYSHFMELSESRKFTEPRELFLMAESTPEFYIVNDITIHDLYKLNALSYLYHRKKGIKKTFDILQDCDIKDYFAITPEEVLLVKLMKDFDVPTELKANNKLLNTLVPRVLKP